MESSMEKAWLHSARISLVFRNVSGTIPERIRFDSARIPLGCLREVCMKMAEIRVKSTGCMESSMEKAWLPSAKIPLAFRNDSVTILLRFRYDSASMSA